MSGKVIPETQRVEALVDATLMKPVDLQRLLARIAEVVDGAPPPRRS
jgi:DNA-binding response OmpR family regulator